MIPEGKDILSLSGGEAAAYLARPAVESFVVMSFFFFLNRHSKTTDLKNVNITKANQEGEKSAFGQDESG